MQQMVYTIRLDLRDTGIVNTSLRLKQGDSGIKIVVNVFNGGVAVFDSSTTPKIVFRRPDGAAVMADMTVESSSYSYTLVGNELQVPGKELIDVKFPLGDTGRESTLSCSIEVVPDTITPNTHGSDIYDNDLAELVAEATAAAETVEEVVGDSEAWAVGERNGVPVGPEDPAYHNNSKWWSEQANVTSLAALTDVDLDALEDGDLLQFNNTTGKWKNSSDVWKTMAQNGAHNFLKNRLAGKSTTVNALTFTADENGVITSSIGTASGTNNSVMISGSGSGSWSQAEQTLQKGTYIASLGGGGSSTLYMKVSVEGASPQDYSVYGNNEVQFTVPSDSTRIIVYLLVINGTVVTSSNNKFYPMIRLATDTDTTYASYAMTNRELTESWNTVIGPLSFTYASGLTSSDILIYAYRYGKIVVISFICNNRDLLPAASWGVLAVASGFPKPVSDGGNYTQAVHGRTVNNNSPFIFTMTSTGQFQLRKQNNTTSSDSMQAYEGGIIVYLTTD